MKKTTKAVTAGIVGVIVATTSLAAWSGNDTDKLRDLDLANQVSMTAEQAIAIALADVPGRVVEAEIEQEGGSVIWEIEVVSTENKRFEFEIDATDGRILEKELDND